MEPLTLIALAAAAGFAFFANNKPAHRQDEDLPQRAEHRRRTYERNTVAHKKRPKLSADFDVSTVEVLPEYDLVKKLVENEFPMVFVTGGAGTGKSTFIKWLVHQFDGAVLLGAPTGMAAINIEGKTLHSLCQLPSALILKKDIKDDPGRREIKAAKVLIIDEISMVTSNLLDGVSAYFRTNRKVDKPFGGIPVIMVGDMFQLPPIVEASTKEFFDHHYTSPKFYGARSLKDITYYGIELNKTFRQVDQVFVDLLTKIREGVDIPETLAALNSGCQITSTPPVGAVWLSPRNAEVNQRNGTELRKIQSPSKTYMGSLEGQFKKDRLPSPMELTLKVGAQVMFTKNDSMYRRWVNGTIGIVAKMGEETITVEILDTGETVELGHATWQDYQYKWDEETKKIQREEIGRYTQYPLLLAWSITIHKSQGRTLERVHIDLGRGAFTTGQTYVALSRCRSMEGLTLSRPLNTSDILVDHESKQFYDHLRSVIKKLPPDELMKQFKDE